MVFLFSDGLLAQTLKTACVRSAHILLVEFKFHMGYGLLPPRFPHHIHQRPHFGRELFAAGVHRHHGHGFGLEIG